MKQSLLFLAIMLLSIADGFSQASFTTGALEVAVSNYGRIRLYTPDGTRHLQRASILVGSSPTAVFDYQNDAEALDPTILVTNPAISDFEIYGSYDNSYSSLPPDVIVKLNAYGWTNSGYIIVKFNVMNDEVNPINATIGLDIIAELNEEYGFDTVTYNNAAGVFRFHRGPQVNMGMKLLSSSLSSLKSFEWYDGYEVDADYWNWMHFGSLQPQYISTTADGPVTITAQNAVTLAHGQSYNVYYALALGSNEQTMLSNISAAVLKYQNMIVSVDDIELSSREFKLDQNSPNPFNNLTTISYNIPETGLVSLKVYNIIGNEVADLVNSNQTKGTHSIDFSAKGLSSGMYFYTLRYGNQIRSNKMFLIK
jgi:hypothetical protein